jgi:hypothetical protein
MADVRYLLAIGVLAAAAAGVVPAGPGLLVGAVLAAFALVAHLRRSTDERHRREQADALLADVPGLRVPDAVAWRAEELVDPRERRSLARALTGLLRDVEGPPTMMLLPANRSAVRANREVIRALASRLAATDRPIDPSAAARVRLLLVRSGSPLYDPEGGDAVRRELAVALRSIDPRR